MIYILFIIGLVLLLKGADWLIAGAKAIAQRLRISDFITGLTIISIGTTMPELLVSVIASVEGNSGLATGNILGSNIANILLILGVAAIICDLPVRRNTILSEVPFAMAAALLVGFLANSSLWYEKSDELEISRGDGIIMFFFFILFVVYIFVIALDSKESEDTTLPHGTHVPLKNIFTLIFFGSSCLFIGAKWVVDGAIFLATFLGMSETFIGLTILALGTSLPELVTAVKSALRKDTDIAVGNAIGSNIFNLLWILSISAVIHPLPFNIASNADILMVIGSTSLILISLIIGRRFIIKRAEGIVFLVAYVAYIYYLILRG